jgi:hypothetical protein
MPREYDHEVYLVPNVVDAEVCQRQARKRQAEGTTSRLHHHKYDEPCANKGHELYPVVNPIID